LCARLGWPAVYSFSASVLLSRTTRYAASTRPSDRAQPLSGERATFFLPRSDDDPRRGRRLMYMRHLACCAGTMAFYSTPSDLVRVGLPTGGASTATWRPDSNETFWRVRC
jgi:hypothetical protein